MMNKKNLLREIAVVSFVVFVILGMTSCGTLDQLFQPAPPPPEGYGGLSIQNQNDTHRITMITVNGITDRTYSRNYQVNLAPKGSGMLAMGGSFTMGDRIEGENLLPIGEYEITIRWSNGAESRHRNSVNNSRSIYNIVNL